jgi:hypothetical protein
MNPKLKGSQFKTLLNKMVKAEVEKQRKILAEEVLTDADFEDIAKNGYVEVTAKVSDNGVYDFSSASKGSLFEHAGYVPDFFPGAHYGDYIKLKIDLESGQIKDWKAVTAEEIKEVYENK